MRRFAAALAVALAGGGTLSVGGRALAQARPDEQSMFGGPAAPSTPAAPPTEGTPAAAPPAATNQPAAPAPSPTPTPTSTPGGGSDRDRFVLGDPNAATKLGSEAAPDNPLTIGGQLYLRAQTSLPWHGDPDTWTLAAPSLIDVFFDARPNDRVRAYLLGRVSYDPTAAPGSVSTAAAPSTTGVAMPTTGFTSFNSTRGPAALLDQMWIAFDIERRVFVTAGKQHVKWGTGHIWTPTDYLHPTKRNPLDVFDIRGGVTMLRLQVPFEEQAANLYGYAVFEDPSSASSHLEQVAGAARAEFILLGAEIGLDVFAKKGQKARFGVDLSTGVGDFDVYADAAIRFGEDFYVVTEDNPTPARLSGVKTQLVAGASWSRKYNDNDLFTVGAEYFYNQPGYTGSGIYPILIQQAAMHLDLPLANFFYLGRHYAAVSLSLPAPYSWNYTTFTLSTLGNLSDGSYVSRFDYSVTFLTHLTFQAFAALHFGQEGGELRFQYVANGITVVPTPFIDLGVALRLKF
ncbi:MAG TPA: hypothetical protein VNO55_08355 [Polyangia bacterium]|nr:hypothetical protein [Polyangia bacterium]